jgi:hypothetical protein
MHKAIGEGFIDHQSGIANARMRSADAAIGRPKGTKMTKGNDVSVNLAGAPRRVAI